MNTRSSVRLLAAAALALLLGACATAPKPLRGQFPSITPRDAVSGTQQVGAQVRWGAASWKPNPARTAPASR